MKELLHKRIDVGVGTSVLTGLFIKDEPATIEIVLDSGNKINIVKSHITIFGESKKKAIQAKTEPTVPESNVPPVAIPVADPPQEDDGEKTVVVPAASASMPIKCVDGSSKGFSDELCLHRCFNNENKCPGVKATFRKGKDKANAIMTAGCTKKSSTCIFRPPQALSECRSDDIIRMLDETLFGNYPT